MTSTQLPAERRYQLGFSESHAQPMYDSRGRAAKASKVLSVLSDYHRSIDKTIADLTLLDIGSSTGFFTDAYAGRVKDVVGVDIDVQATSFASHNSTNPANYVLGDSLNLSFADNTFDVVTCTHVYEHVPDAPGLLAEIYRVLKPGGVCYFAAGNRLILMEGHYHLPLLSVVPKPWANLYLRALGRGREYYESHLTYWQLRDLVRQFQIIDYTKRIVGEPDRFSATDVLKSGTWRHRMAQILADKAYWLVPTYHWLLRKDSRD